MEETREIIANNFIEEFVMQDMQKNPVVQTRFPPEPNGYLHIGHAKALCIDFGVAEKFGGKCNLRFDDTNPTKEDVEYVDAIQYDIRWLGFEWDKLRFGSEYFDKCYELAVKLITTRTPTILFFFAGGMIIAKNIPYKETLSAPTTISGNIFPTMIPRAVPVHQLGSARAMTP